MKTNGFLWRADPPGFLIDDGRNDTGLPRVSAARHAELMAAQAEGAAIVTGPAGRPVIQRPSDTAATRRAALGLAVKREAARRIDAVAPLWRQLNDQRTPSPDGLARFERIDLVRAASDAIEAVLAAAGADELAAFPVADHPLWPEFD